MNKYVMNEDNESLFVRRTAFRDFRSFYMLIMHIDIEKKLFFTKNSPFTERSNRSSVNRTIFPVRSHYLQNPGRPVPCHFLFYLTK